MSGHNKWSQIKNKKAKTDDGRGKLFSKLAKNISIAAKDDPDPKFNPTLRSAVEQARRQNMPQANIERAIKQASEVGEQEELLIEAYGPEGVGILIEAFTDNRNRSMAEIKLIFKERGVKLAEPGSLAWAFEKTVDGYVAKFKSPASEETKKAVSALLEEVEERDDVTQTYSSLAE
ncbi:YebC/PmpR family DNA-binding transcriptional regulator [Patescibacteria group bacterium]|nr:YebC/PmpR family DNA-binding transcriptional regulator [Patescibacteria group bacterium]